MEALGGAASIIAVATIALQSAKAVYATVNGIKRGPKEVNDLASAVKRLSYILEQVTEISSMLSDMDGTDLSGVERAMEECAQSLADFRKRVENLDVLPDERKLGKVWKSIKSVIQKEDFRRMWETVNHYINVFGTHLSLIGRRSDHARNDDFARHMKQTGTDSKVLKQNSDMLKLLENGLSGVQNGLTRQEAQRKVDSHQMKAGQQAAESLEGRLNGLAGMSTRQYETIMEKLAQIHNQVEECKASTVPTHETFTPEMSFSDNSGKEKAKEYTEDNYGNELSESIDRLCGLATKPRTTAFSDEAQQIIADLEKILNFVSREAKLPETRETRKRKLADLESAKVSRYSKQDLDFKRLQGLLISSPCISVNEQASFNPSITSENRRYRKMTFQHYDTNIGSLFVEVKKRRLMENADRGENNTLITKPDQEVEDIFEGTVSFIPKRTDRRTKISTSFFQRLSQDGFSSLSPRLSFCAIIPDNSEIFTLVERGDLKGIINHLQQGKASLSDCDTEGRTLLNYALYHIQDEICKFLIDKGADVDTMEPRLVPDGLDLVDSDYVVSTFDRIDILTQDSDYTEEDLTSVTNCRRLLLSAGADPTTHGTLDMVSRAHWSPIRRKDSLALIINLGGEFINYESKDECGYTILLFSSCGLGSGLNPDCIKLLLDRGASVMARNNWGSTCLHLAHRSLRSLKKSAEKDSLLLLVRAGADVYAEDSQGRSVSDLAYTPNDWDEDMNLGTYRRDLWDEVLTECGYDPAAVHGRVQEFYEVSDSEEEVSDCEEEVSDSEDEVSDCEEEVSNSDERESMIEEQDYEMDGQDFDNTERTCDVVIDDTNILSSSSSLLGDSLKLPEMEENIWNKTYLMLENSVYGSLPSTDNPYNLLQPDDLSAFNTEESHPYLQDAASISSTFQENWSLPSADNRYNFPQIEYLSEFNSQESHRYLQDTASISSTFQENWSLPSADNRYNFPQTGDLSEFNSQESHPYLQDAASISSTFQGNRFFDIEDEMKDWNVWA